jgi:hypothetical protein
MSEYTPPKPKAPVVEEPKTPTPTGVTKEDLDRALEVERAKMAADKAALQAQADTYNSRMQMLETLLSDRMRGKTPPPEVPAPTVSDEDFLTPDGARKAAERLAEEKAMQVGKAIDANYRSTMTQMLEDQFDSKLEALKSREFYKYVEKDIEAAIQKNPNIRLAPRALDILYNSFVGAKGKEIVEAEKAAAIATNQEITNAEEAPVRLSPGSRRESVAAPSAPARPSRSNTPVLSEREEYLRGRFAQFLPKDHLTPERWAELKAERAATRSDIPNMEERGRK